MWKYLVYSLRIRRLEFRVAELPIFLIPMFLTVYRTDAFLSAAFWEGLVLFLFLFVFGDLLNCLADRDLDAIDKPRLSEAVYGVGVRGVVLQAVMSAVAALALATHLAWKYDRWLLVPGAAFALFVAYAYSVPPLRLKGRGLWQLAFYWLGLFAGPMIYTAMFFRPWPALDVLAVSVAYGILQTGVLLINTAEDYPEDRQLGVRTVIVVLGLRSGLALASILTVVGALALLAAFRWTYAARGLYPQRLWALLPLVVSCLLVAIAVGKVSRQVQQVDEPAGVAAVKRAGKRVPLWITAGALSSLAAAAAAFPWGRP